MTTINEKIKLFSKIVFDNIDEEMDKKMKEIEKEKEQLIAREKSKIEKSKTKDMENMYRKSKVKSNEIVSKAKLSRQKEILKLKDDLINKQIQNITNKITNFVETDEYKKILFSKIESLKDNYLDKEYIIYLNRKDFNNYKDDLSKKLSENFSLQFVNSDILGGFILEDKNKTMRLDNSLANKIESFKENIGIKVNKIFE